MTVKIEEVTRNWLEQLKHLSTKVQDAASNVAIIKKIKAYKSYRYTKAQGTFPDNSLIFVILQMNQ